MNKLEISQRSSKRPNGRILIEYLLENGYLEIGKTELIYKFDGKTVIIMLEGNRREYQYRVGIGEGDYDGKQEVEAFGDKYGRLRDAAVDAERRLGSVSSNGGKIVYDMVLINTGKKEIEGTTIGEAWNLLKRKTDGQIH